MKHRSARMFALFTTAVLAACGPAAPQIVVRDAWSRPTALREDLTADHIVTAPGVVYLTIVNEGQASDRLLSVSTAVCASPELHQTLLVDDRMRMQLVEDGLEIPAGGRLELAPGGAHIMLLDLHADLLAGESFELGLEFEVSGTVTVRSQVRAP